MAIHFHVGSAEIRPDAIAALHAKLDLLRGIPALRIRVEGQADVRGSSASNITLAWTRAEAAKHWLTARGIASDRIDAVGFSSWRPICEDPQESCLWQTTCRVVIVAGAWRRTRTHEERRSLPLVPREDSHRSERRSCLSMAPGITVRVS